MHTCACTCLYMHPHVSAHMLMLRTHVHAHVCAHVHTRSGCVLGVSLLGRRPQQRRHWAGSAACGPRQNPLQPSSPKHADQGVTTAGTGGRGALHSLFALVLVTCTSRTQLSLTGWTAQVGQQHVAANAVSFHAGRTQASGRPVPRDGTGTAFGERVRNVDAHVQSQMVILTLYSTVL